MAIRWMENRISSFDITINSIGNAECMLLLVSLETAVKDTVISI
jgi:hypothetical protein